MASPSSTSKIVLHPPHFFKIIIHKNLEDRTLMIPETFIREYGKFLSSSICLEAPDGLKWEVGLTASANGTVWLHNGWHQFAEHYKLKYGSLLIFRFDGNSNFHTIIFHGTGSEISYQPSEENLENNVSISPSPKKEAFISPKIEEEENFLREISSCKKEPKYRISRPISMQISSSPKKVGAEKTGFKVVLTKSMVGGRYNMMIPKEFAREHLKNEKSGTTIEIQNSDGKIWSLLSKWSQSHQNDYAYISSGWKSFAKENHLKEGDVAFFQMIKKDQFLFTLLEQASPSHHPINSPPITNKLEIEAMRNPSFSVKIHNKSYKNQVLNIPLSFANYHLSSTITDSKLIVEKNQWNVKIKQYERCFRFSAGWTTFYSQNGLEEGDSCLFKLVYKSESHCTFEVNILKKK